MNGKFFLSAFAALFVCSFAAHGATKTWTGAGASANWHEAANWQGGIPAAGDTLVFRAVPGKEASCNDLANLGYEKLRIETPITFSCSTIRITGTQPVEVVTSGAVNLGNLALDAPGARLEMSKTGATLDVHVGELRTQGGTTTFAAPGVALTFDGAVTMPAGSTLKIQATDAAVRLPGITTAFRANLDIDGLLEISNPAQLGDDTVRPVFRGSVAFTSAMDVYKSFELAGPVVMAGTVARPSLVLAANVSLWREITVTGDQHVAGPVDGYASVLARVRGAGRFMLDRGDVDLYNGSDARLQVGSGSGTATARLSLQDNAVAPVPTNDVGIAGGGDLAIVGSVTVRSVACAGTLTVVAPNQLTVQGLVGVGGCRIPLSYFVNFAFPDSGAIVTVRSLAGTVAGVPFYADGTFWGSTLGLPLKSNLHMGAGNDFGFTTSAVITSAVGQVSIAPGGSADVTFDARDDSFAHGFIAGVTMHFSVEGSQPARGTVTPASMVLGSDSRGTVRLSGNASPGAYELVARVGSVTKRIPVLQGTTGPALTLYPNAVTMSSPAGQQAVSVEAPGCRLVDVSTTMQESIRFDSMQVWPNWSADFHGAMVSFKAQGDCGRPMRVRVRLPSPPPANATFRYYGFGEIGNQSTGNGWFKLPTVVSGDIVSFELEDGAAGDYDRIANGTIELKMGGVGTGRPLQDMWWGGPIANGWGVSVVQHDDRHFAVVYAYDANGQPTWFVMPDMRWSHLGQHLESDVYSPRGTPFHAYDASRLVAGNPVGRSSWTFADKENGHLDPGFGSRVFLQRQLFGPPSTASVPQVGDMWWGGPAQNGWGVAILQQYASLFSVWFTYDDAGAPTWYVMPAGSWTSADTYEGRMYRAFGPTGWMANNYVASQLQSRDVGAFRFRFSGNTATMDYSIDARSGTLQLQRQGF